MSTLPEKAKNPKSIQEVLGATLGALANAATGLATSDSRENIALASRLFHALRRGKFLGKLKDEWDDLIASGRVISGFEGFEETQECLQELLDYLDAPLIDETHFKCMKALFMRSVDPSLEEGKRLLAPQYMKLCRKLESAEILIIRAAYDLAKSSVEDFNAASKWLEIIAEKSGLKHTSLVELHEEHLMALRILTGRYHGDRSGIVLKPHFRLTNLGFSFAMFMDEFDSL